MLTFENDQQRATAYAVYKYLEDAFKNDEKSVNRIALSSTIDVSGFKMEIVLPPGTVISRGEKEFTFKKATQNLNGWAVLTKIVERLRTFNQWNVIRIALLNAVRAALKKDTETETELVKIDPELNTAIELLRDELALPQRKEVTPNRIDRSDEPMTMTFRKPKGS